MSVPSAACSTISRVIDTESVGCHPRSTTKEKEEWKKRGQRRKVSKQRVGGKTGDKQNSGGRTKKIGRPISGVQDVSQEEI